MYGAKVAELDARFVEACSCFELNESERMFLRRFRQGPLRLSVSSLSEIHGSMVPADRCM